MNIEELQAVTNDTLKEVRHLDVVTPNLFAETFYEKATQIDPNFSDDDIRIDANDKILDKIVRFQEQTHQHTDELKNSIDLATVAIQNKDDKSLGEVKNNIDDLYKRILLLEEQVYLDELTKVQNRKWLFEKVLDNNTFKEDGAISFIDIDKFKVINDTHGHVAGDKVLIMIATLIGKIKESKTVRYGGDEFITISNKLNAKEQEHFFNTINNNLSKKDLTYQGKTFKIGISFGSIDFKAGDSFQEVIEQVDKIMYEHKKKRAKVTA